MADSRAGLIILTAGITASLTSAVWIGIGAVAYWYVVDEPPPFVVKIDSPSTVTAGEQIELVIEVSNPTGESLELGSIDLYDSLIDGFAILTIDPPPDSRDSTLGFTTLYFSRSLAPGASFTANLALQARDAGVWTGDIDCCTPFQKFVTTSHTIVVTDRNSRIPSAEGGADDPASAVEPATERDEKPGQESKEPSR